ncbi:hypothetical protein PQU95_16425 [Vogesella sp. DC21W]|uniref:Uncharacterized protein n=1 Tax=Vogesella aquatica TaxID=2984206 RepID=A0ABT5J2A1_9NEIS|nr:hypothetical protein [Vogesella aquatica]MDC7718787.1 hypothetical protein [Vogesella aquatica]
MSQQMAPLSARIPADLYTWLAALQLDGATTTSDKLRILLGQLKKEEDILADPAQAHVWLGERLYPLRQALNRIELQSGQHSDALTLLLQHSTQLMALLLASQPHTQAQATELEAQLVSHTLRMAELLLRQGLGPQHASYDPDVIHQGIGGIVALAALYPTPRSET